MAETLWAACVNQDMAMESSSEAWGLVATLVDMLKGTREVDPELLARLDEHRAHVVKCRTGSCEHEYAVLVRIGSAIPVMPPVVA